MNQFHTLALDVCIRGARDSDDIWLRLVKLVPFVPMQGMTLELWRDTEDDEATHKITLENTCYSFQHSMFIEEQADDSLYEASRNGVVLHSDKQELVDWYKSFGFLRLNFPTVNIGEGNGN